MRYVDVGEENSRVKGVCLCERSSENLLFAINKSYPFFFFARSSSPQRVRIEIKCRTWRPPTHNTDVDAFSLSSVAGIRHPEELSLCKPLDAHHLKYNLKDMQNKKHVREANSTISPDTNTFILNQSPASSTGSLDKTPQFICAPLTPVKHNGSTPISSPVTVGYFLYKYTRRGFGWAGDALRSRHRREKSPSAVTKV